MNHTKNIRPTGTSGNAPVPSLPDRSDLSSLYVSAKSGRLPRPGQSGPIPPPEEKADKATSRLAIGQTVTSLLLTVLLAVTYLTAIYIYAGADTSSYAPSPLYLLFSFIISAICVITWIVTFRMLWKRFSNYDIRLSIFIGIYLFYLLPLLKLTYSLFPVNWIGMAATILLWLIANRLIVWYIVWASNSRVSSGMNKGLVIALPVAALVVCAVIF